MATKTVLNVESLNDTQVMEKERFHNVSDSPPETTSTDDQQDMQLEIKRLTFQLKISELNMKANTSRFELENKKLKHKDENKKYVELEKEIFSLEKRNQDLAAENSKLLKNQKTTKERVRELQSKVEHLQKLNSEAQVAQFEGDNTLKLRIPIKEKLIEHGVARFLENGPVTKAYDSYAQWYDDVSEIMEKESLYEYGKYLFVRDIFKPDTKIWVYQSSVKGKEVCIKSDFKTETLDRGWTEENIRWVLILHPTKAESFEELSHCYTGNNDQKDCWNGRFNYSIWKSKVINSADFSKEMASSDSGKRHSMILCCIKN